MVPQVLLDLVVSPVGLFVREEIGVSGCIEPVGAGIKGELDFVQGADADAQQEEGQSREEGLGQTSWIELGGLHASPSFRPDARSGLYMPDGQEIARDGQKAASQNVRDVVIPCINDRKQHDGRVKIEG